MVVKFPIVLLLVEKLPKCQEYIQNKFDLAGFTVGVVSKKIITQDKVKNDIILAIPSSGLHLRLLACKKSYKKSETE